MFYDFIIPFFKKKIGNILAFAKYGTVNSYL